MSAPKELIFNVFLDVKEGFIVRVGINSHLRSGTDEEKLGFLQGLVERDFLSAIWYPLPDNVNPPESFNELAPATRSLKWSSYLQLSENGRLMDLLEPILSQVNAPQKPMLVVTSVWNGIPRVDGCIPLRTTANEATALTFSVPPHFLERYIRDGKFHFAALLNDDFFLPIKLLLNHEYPVAATKLLLSTIDTFAFIMYGDEKNVFKRFLLQYFEIEKLGVTVDELWELRNAMVHMTSYESRQVKQQKVKPLVLTRGKFPSDIDSQTFDGKILDVDSLFVETACAVERWGNGLVQNPELWAQFVERYEMIISENHAWKTQWL